MLSGFSIGLESSVWAIVAIAIALGVAIGLGNSNIELTFYLIALIGIGLLATAGMVVSEDSFGPVSDNAAGIAEMSGEFTGEAERVMVSLDAVGNTTKAITKGVAIGSAVIAAVALFAAFIETINSQLNLHLRANQLLVSPFTQINVFEPKDLHRAAHRWSIGLLVLVPRHPGRRPLRRDRRAPRCAASSASTRASWTTPRSPSTGVSSSICTARHSGARHPGPAGDPVAGNHRLRDQLLRVGCVPRWTTLTGQLLANTLSNSGGAWDNAKKYIEDGNEGGKGSEAHKAAVIGDTVGDPFKDTAGPALNPMIKVMNLVSLLILPGRDLAAERHRRLLRPRGASRS